MRGSPLLRALFVFVALLALAWPLSRITSVGASAPPVATGPSAPEVKEVRLQLTFSTPPRRIAVRHLEAEIWSMEAPGAEVEQTLALAWPRDGVELVFRIEWPADAPIAAARVRLTDPEGEEHERTIWGGGAVEEVLTFL